MAEVKIVDIQKTFEGAQKRTLLDINFTVKDTEFVSLLGPSGCGKTTLLRIIAGLEEQDSGQVHIGGKDMSRVNPRDRDMAFVFQNYALYPHFTVEENISLGLKLRKVPAPDIRKRVGETAAMLGLEKYLERRPKALSGGQRQRVALARALVRNPKVFLLDEPLSNLDARLRDKTRGELKLLFKKVRGTVIYVTHDQIEAMTLSDRIVILREGVIQQIGTPDEIYTRPANTFVATFIGTPPMNLVHKKDCEASGITPPASASAHADFICGVRPENVAVSQTPKEGWRKAEVRLSEPTGAVTLLTLSCGDATLRCSTSERWPVDQKDAWVRSEPSAVHLFDAESGSRLTPQ
ncbi:MAG: ABC transporter ATP-binding protein [Elusimicrobiota bacterium]|jgi:ABC-type sugar transport system ATPase subunit